MENRSRFKLRLPTWIGLIAVVLSLLYCNLYSIASGTLANRGTTSGWPFIYLTETVIVNANAGGVTTSHEITRHIDWAAIAFNLLAAVGLLAGTGLTIERFLRPGSSGQFTLGATFNLVTIVAIAFGLRAIESILFGHGFWSEVGVEHDRDLFEQLQLAPPWPVRVVLLISIAATLLQALRSIVWLIWRGVRGRSSADARPPIKN